MNFINDKQNSTVMFYNNITELSNVQVDPINKETWDGILDSDRRLGKRGWGNTDSNKEWFGVEEGRSKVREICELYGWPDGRRKGFEAIKNIEVPRLPSFKRKRVRTNQGHSLDIHSVYSGNLDHAWEGFSKQKSSFSYKGHVSIFVNIGANCHVSAEQMFWRGATAAVIARALLQSGRNVRIIACDSLQNSADNYHPSVHGKIGTARSCTMIVLKDYSFPINYDSLFASTALAGFFRHYFFKSVLSLPYKIYSHLGSAVQVVEQDFERFFDDSPSIFVENVWSLSQAVNRVENFKRSIELDILETRKA